MKNSKKVIIIGAGPGGLTSGMILSHRGLDVSIFEKNDYLGGRNGAISEQGFVFDIGPTFLMMKYILDEMFELSGRRSGDYLDFYELDPMYHLKFSDFELPVSANPDKMRQAIKKYFPGEEAGLDKFIAKEKKRFEKVVACFEKDYSDFYHMVAPPLLPAIPHLSLGRSLYRELGSYFHSDKLKIAFTFQAKYLGMSPWQCPAAFMIIPYIEHRFGIYHVKGGLSKISEAMAKVIREDGGKINLSSPVKRVITEKKKAVGVELADGSRIFGDYIIINADFSQAMTTLFEPGFLKKYAPAKIMKKRYSCSTFMLYLGLDKIYDEPHHKIIIADDYKNNIDKISKHQPLKDDFSIYVRNASITDPTLAPAGKSAVYVLVPVANNKSGIDWNTEKEYFRDKVMEIIKRRTSMSDIESHVELEKIITPLDWAEERDVYLGATFNLSHNLSQMLYFRPHNKFEEAGNCFLVGGGTHPGSGLPTIYESGRITADLISKLTK